MDRLTYHPALPMHDDFTNDAQWWATVTKLLDHLNHDEQYEWIQGASTDPDQQRRHDIALWATIQNAAADREKLDLAERYELGAVHDLSPEAVQTMIDAKIAGGFAPAPEPVKLDLTTPEPPPFPYEVLPQVLVDFIEAESIAKGGHPDIAACAALCAISCIANQHGITLDDGLGWRERLNLFMIISAHRGEGKSPVFKAIMKPIDQLAKGIEDKHNKQVSANAQKLKILTEELKRADMAAAGDNATPEQRNKALELQEDLDDFKRTASFEKFRMHIGGDATPEGFVKVLSSQRGILSVLDDEGTFFSKMRKYSDGLDVTSYLKAFDGGEILPVRASSEAPTGVKEAHATFMFMVQPSILAEALMDPELKGVGFTDRFLIAAPPTMLGSRSFVDRRRASATAGYEFNLWVNDLWNTIEFSGGTVYQMSEDATLEFDRYRDRLEATIDPQAPTDSQMAFSKRHKVVLRLCGLLHFMHQRPESQHVGTETLLDAIKLTGYFIEHYDFYMNRAEGDMQSEAARKLVRWVKGRDSATFSARDIVKSSVVKSTHERTDDVHELLGVMIDSGIIGTDQPDSWFDRKRGTRGATFWLIHDLSESGQKVSGGSSDNLRQLHYMRSDFEHLNAESAKAVRLSGCPRGVFDNSISIEKSTIQQKPSGDLARKHPTATTTQNPTAESEEIDLKPVDKPQPEFDYVVKTGGRISNTPYLFEEEPEASDS